MKVAREVFKTGMAVGFLVVFYMLAVPLFNEWYLAKYLPYVKEMFATTI